MHGTVFTLALKTKTKTPQNVNGKEKRTPKKVPLAEKLMHNFQNPKLYRAYAAKLFRPNPKVY